jgi:hypothetical protein
VCAGLAGRMTADYKFSTMLRDLKNTNKIKKSTYFSVGSRENSMVEYQGINLELVA